MADLMTHPANPPAPGDTDAPAGTAASLWGAGGKVLSPQHNAAQELSDITDAIPGGVAKIAFDEGFTVLYANAGFYAITGHTPEEFAALRWQAKKLIHPDDLPAMLETITRQAAAGQMLEAQYRIVKRDGSVAWMALRASRVSQKEGVPIFQCLIMDVSAQREVQRALDMERERYRIVSTLSDDILFEYDIATNTFYSFMGQKKEGPASYLIQDKAIHAFRQAVLAKKAVHPQELPLFYRLCDYLEQGKDEFSLELRGLMQNGGYTWQRIQGKAMCDEGGKPVRVVGRVDNIDRERREMLELRDKAQRDALTGLYNKETVRALVSAALEAGPGKCHALMIADADGFKEINDNFGHLFGDAVLAELAGNMRAYFDAGELIGRIGGDEFLLFLPDIHGEEEALRKAAALCGVYRSTRVGARKYLNVSGSVGVALSPQHGEGYEQLFLSADAALYAAKRAGRDRWVLYSPAIAPKERGEGYLNSYEQASVPRGVLDPQGNLENYARDVIAQARDADSAIHLLLSMIGKRFQLDRASVYELRACGAEIPFEWRRAGIPSAAQAVAHVPHSLFSLYSEVLSVEETLCIGDCRAATLPGEVRAHFEGMGAGAQLHCRIKEGGRLRGSLCFEVCCGPREWGEGEIASLGALTGVIGSYLTSMRTKHQIESERTLMEAVAKNQNLYPYVLDPVTYELMYVPASTRLLFPLARTGDICYRSFRDREIPCENCPMDKKSGGRVEFYSEKLRRWLSATATKIGLQGGETAMLVCCSDLSAPRPEEAGADQLTGLLSMAQFETQAVRVLKVRGSRKYALLYSDFNKFKYINDAQGYEMGNRVLASFAKAFSAQLEKGELCCRYSSDMFITLLRYRDEAQLGERLRKIFAALDAWRESQFRGLQIAIIGGLYLIKPEDESFSAIIDRANLARKSIKGTHQRRCAVYDAAMHQRFSREKDTELRMEGALENGEFTVYLQPKISLGSGGLAGAEALVRWERPGQPVVPPAEFIPLFEKNGFIRKLDFYMAEQVFKMLREWLDRGLAGPPVSINVSRAYVRDPAFLEHLRTLTGRYRIPPRLIELELTESLFIDETQALLQTVDALREMGFVFSIDDFGAGYSSLNLLRLLPIDVLKLDRGFFDRDSTDPRERIVLSGVISIAKSLQMTVLTEGAETAEQVRFLREAGCDLVQGFYFDGPLPRRQFEAKYLGMGPL